MRRIAFAALALAACAQALAQPAASYAARPEVRSFIEEMVERHGLRGRDLEALFAHAQRQDRVLQAIQTPASSNRTWQEYRALFVNKARVDAGVAFWKKHRAALERAKEDFGTSEETVVAILGVETFYGRDVGRWRVLEALATLAFDYPPRAAYFRGELESFLLVSRTARMNALAVKGSYAGAIGIPQFMPGTYLKFAVDFDGDGVPDLRRNPVDAIGSVANFLMQHGWLPGAAVQLRAEVSRERDLRPYADGSLEPRHNVQDLIRAGVAVRGEAPGEAQVALIELAPPEQGNEYRLGFHNFWVITRYNRSAFYASVVADLAETLRARNP